MRTDTSKQRRAFTLLELLVVLAIIGVLLGLLVPAIQKTREAASQLACRNNLKQIGLAIHQFESDFRCLPSNGGWDGKQTIPDVNGAPINVWTQIYLLKSTFFWGVGDPQRFLEDQPGTWTFAILPYIEQQGIYQGRLWSEPVTVYICPSRRIKQALATQNDLYGAYFGGAWTWGKCDYSGNGFVFPNRPNCYRLAQITDGASNTILVGEKVMEPGAYPSGSWYWDEPYFLGGTNSSARFGLEVLRDAQGVTVPQNWGSAHPTAAQFLFADGSVRSLAYGLAPNVVQALLTPDEGEPNPNY